jgi:hypothetical protein
MTNQRLLRLALAGAIARRLDSIVHLPDGVVLEASASMRSSSDAHAPARPPPMFGGKSIKPSTLRM